MSANARYNELMSNAQIIRASAIAYAILGVVLIACTPSNTQTFSDGSFTIRYALKEKRRVDRTTFDFVYEGAVVTTGPTETGVKALASTVAASTQVIDPFLMFPGATAGSWTASFDTFTIRQNRDVAFDPHSLTWTVAALPLPPDPGDAGIATLPGVDSDQDGVRDDLQRFIELSHPDSAAIRAAFREISAAKQEILLASEHEADSIEASRKSLASNECLVHIAGTDAFSMIEAFKPELLNTWDRTKAWNRANQHFSGQTYRLSKDLSQSCAFDPSAFEN